MAWFRSCSSNGFEQDVPKMELKGPEMDQTQRTNSIEEECDEDSKVTILFHYLICQYWVYSGTKTRQEMSKNGPELDQMEPEGARTDQNEERIIGNCKRYFHWKYTKGSRLFMKITRIKNRLWMDLKRSEYQKILGSL